MYEHFNPFDSDEAGWPYALLVLGALVLGYLIGFASQRRQATALEKQRLALERALEECQAIQKPLPTGAPPLKRTPPEVPPAAAVAPLPDQIPMDNAFLTTAVLTESQSDDLTLVEGIGPAIAGLLRKAGISTFAALAGTPADDLTGLLRATGPEYQIHNPSTWPEQARLAAEGQWEELKTYQESLDAGRTLAGAPDSP